MFTISLCMIVKDEELTLERILSQASKFADEIIIVDTGSKDRTIEIAKRFTQNVYRFEWCDNFSKARNYSFSFATKDYIMWLDADDYITEDNISKILDLKKSNKDVDVYMLKYLLFSKDNISPDLEYYRERLLKRSNNYRWEGFVHEAIAPSGNIKYVDINIEHRKEHISNPKRNLQLYNKAIKKGTTLSPREQYYYSRELYYNGYLSKSITNLKKYLKMENKYYVNEMEAYILLSDIYQIKNKLNLARETLFEYIKNNSPNAEIACKIASIFYKENNLEASLFWYNTALICPRQKFGFCNPDFSNFIPYISLCQIYYTLGKYDLAKEYHIKASKLKPTHPSIIYNSQFFN